MSHRGQVWQSYTPAWTSSGSSPSIGNGTLTGKYLHLSGVCFVNIYLAPGSTTSPGTGYSKFGLPITAVDQQGVWHAIENEGGYAPPGVGEIETGLTTVRFWQNTSSNQYWNNELPCTDPWTAGADYVAIWGVYRV